MAVASPRNIGYPTNQIVQSSILQHRISRQRPHTHTHTHQQHSDPQLDVTTKIVDLLAEHQRHRIHVHARRGSGASRGRRVARPSSRAAAGSAAAAPQARAEHPLARRLLLQQSPRQQWSVVASFSLCFCVEALGTSTFRGARKRARTNAHRE